MKRRLQGLAATTGSTAKKGSWRDDDKKKPSGGESKAFSDSDPDNELLADAKAAEANTGERTYTQNPVVWMDISVAGKPRGKVFFELFFDTAPEAAELMRSLCAGPLKGTELHKIIPRRVAEGGDVDLPASALEAAEEAQKNAGSSPAMTHSKAGLLTCKPAGPNGYDQLLFQITLCPSPELDGAQKVFGQLVAEAGGDTDRLHALHWVSAAGNAAGTPRDTVLVESCGICDGAEAERITGQPQLLEPPYPPPESQEERYSRAGNVYSQMADAMSSENVKDALELTEDLIDYLEWDSKKAKREGGGGGTRMYRSAEIETELRELRGVLESAGTKAGEVQGFEGKHGRNVQSQLIRIKELSEILNRVF